MKRRNVFMADIAAPFLGTGRGLASQRNPKRIDLLRTPVPIRRRIALLSNPRHAREEKEIAACQSAVRPLGIELLAQADGIIE